MKENNNKKNKIKKGEQWKEIQLKHRKLAKCIDEQAHG